MSCCALLFPGQGSQHSGMGRALAEAFAESREVFEQADRALESSISAICFEGSEEQLELTENTQPAVLTVSVAALRALEARGVRAVAAAGHSLGEYSAHVAAGTLAFDDAVRTVRARGRFMQLAVPVGQGAMAAILGLEQDELAAICEAVAGSQVVSPANLNAPGQIVIAGHSEAVDRAVEAARQAGARRAVPLPVSAPFHCALMRPAADRLRPVLDSIQMQAPSMPVYTNADAAPVATADGARQALVRQVTAPVRWAELAGTMFDSGIDSFIEVGPGRVLAGLMRRIRKAARVFNVEDPDGLQRAVSELGA